MNKVSVIIITYNSEGYIKECLESVIKFEEKNVEIIVLDNNSSDKTNEILTLFKNRIKLILSPENLGFSKGNNLAVKSSSKEFLLFLNPDTKLTEPVIEKMQNFYRQNNDIGLIGPQLIMTNGQIQPSVKKLPTIKRAFDEFILNKKNSYSEYIPESKIPIEVEAVYGATMFIEKKLFKLVKGFDEKFFLYYEDIDLCRRIRNTGKKIYYFPLVKIMHQVGASKSEFDRNKLNYSSSVLYHGFLKSKILQIIFFLNRLIQKLS